MEVNPNTHFTRKEVFMGEEIEAIYLKARKPLADIDGIDLSASDDPMLRMGQVLFQVKVRVQYPSVLRHKSL